MNVFSYCFVFPLPLLQWRSRLFVGLGSVGKTSIFTQFCHGEFDPKHNTTLQATFDTKRITLADNTRVDLAIWVLARPSSFHKLLF